MRGQPETARVSLVLIDAPFHLGLKRPRPDREPGARYGGWQLRQMGLLERLAARDGGELAAPGYTGERDEATGVLHGTLLADAAMQLADRLEPLLAGGEFPLVLGGDCTIVLGAGLALARRGRHGLLYVDGHRDLLLPADSQSGSAAGMALALAVGLGPEALTHIEGHNPLFNPEDVLVFGTRDEDRWYQDATLEFQRDRMHTVTLDAARSEEVPRALRRRLPAIAEGANAGFWLHLDVDVLDDGIMAATDARAPGGMSSAELVELLRSAIASGRCLGMHVTNYDPERDRGSVAARILVEILSSGLAALSPPKDPIAPPIEPT
jgi:arginase